MNNTLKKRILSINKKFVLILGFLFMIPILAVVLQSTFQSNVGAELSDAKISFIPSAIQMPPEKGITMVLDTGTTKVGFVRISASFDKNKIQLTNDIIVNSLFTVIKKTSLSDANATGAFTIVGVISPSGTTITPPSGVISFATFVLRSSSQVNNDTTSLQVNLTDSQIVSLDALTMPIVSESLAVSLNTNIQTPIPSASIAPTIYATPTSIQATPTRISTPVITLQPSATSISVPSPTILPPADNPNNGLIGEYFDTQNLAEDSLKFTRIDPQINFNWGNKSPDQRIAPNTYSIRWSGYITAPASGEYEFYTETDDGVKLWIDGKLRIWDWSRHSVKTNSAKVSLVAGRSYAIKMEYFEATGNAVSRLGWKIPGKSKELIPTTSLFTKVPEPVATLPGVSPMPTLIPTLLPAPKDNGLVGSYFSGRDFANLSFTRIDKNVNFDWSYGSPDLLKLTNDNFSIEWNGFLQAPTTGDYTFYAASDDGMKVWFNNDLVINEWKDRPLTETSFTVRLDVGDRYPIKIQYYENYNHATAKLLWQGPNINKQIIPSEFLYTN